MELCKDYEKIQKTIKELCDEWKNEKNIESLKEMVYRFNKVDKVYFYSGNFVLPALKYMIRKKKLMFSYQNYYMLRSFFKHKGGKIGIKWFLKRYVGKAEYNDNEKINQFTEFDFVLDFYKCVDIHPSNYDLFFNQFILKSNFLKHNYQDFKLFLQVIIRKKDKIMLKKYFKFIEKNKTKVFSIGNKVKVDKVKDGYLWLWYKIKGDEKEYDWFNRNNPLFFRTFFRINENLTDSRETIWDYFIIFLKKKNYLPNPNSNDLCKTIYMNENLFLIFTEVFKDFSSPELLNGILTDLIKPDLNSYLLKGILNNWKINLDFLNRLSFKIIKNYINIRNLDKEGINNINYLIKKGSNIEEIEEIIGTRYDFVYESFNKSSFDKYIKKKINCLPFTLVNKLEEMKLPLIKWIKKK